MPYKNFNSDINTCQLNLLKKVMDIVTGNFSLARDEFLELVYDVEGNRDFCLARHVKSLKELREFLKSHVRENICFCPALRTVPVQKKNKRTGGEYVSRLKAIILDVEDEQKHKDKNSFESPESVQAIISKTLSDLPEPFKQASPVYTAYTGGGGQVCFIFDRWLSRQEAELIFRVFREYVKTEKSNGRLQYVDVGALKPEQPMRLISTRNVSRRVDTFFLEVNVNPKPIVFEELLGFLASWADEKEEKEELEDLKKKGKYSEEEENIKALIKKKVSFQNIYEFKKIEDKGKYYRVLCPFHEENNPSFVIYRNPDKEVAIDCHDCVKYDVFAFYQKINNVDFSTAKKELAKIAGIEMKKSEGPKGIKGRSRKTFINVEEIQERIWEILKIQRVIMTMENGITIFEFHAPHRNGKIISFQLQAKYMRKSSTFEKAFQDAFTNATGRVSELRAINDKLDRIPKKEKAEIVRLIWNGIIERIEEMIEDRTEESLDVMIYDELIDLIIESKATQDFEEFEKDKAKYVKFVDEDGTVYVKAKALLKYIQATSPHKHVFTERKLYNMLKQLGAQMVRLNKGKRPRVWRLPDNRNWLTLDENKIEKLQPMLDLEPPGSEQVQERVLEAKKEVEEVKQEVKEEKELKREVNAEVKAGGNGTDNSYESEVHEVTSELDIERFCFTESSFKDSMDQDAEIIVDVVDTGLDVDTECIEVIDEDIPF